MTFSEVTSIWGVSAVANLDCSLNVYACSRQKALTMPADCVAANCNNSQATQSITVHEFPRNRHAVRRKFVKFVQFKRADVYAAPQSRPFECDFVNFMAEYQMGLSHAHLCSEHFENFMAEYQIGFASKRNLKHSNTQISILLLFFLYLFVELMIMMNE